MSSTKSSRSVDLALWNWFRQPAGQEALSQAAQSLVQGNEDLHVLTRLRREYGSTKGTAILAQAKLRLKGREKFSAADRMLLTSRGLAQATGEIIARYKAGRMGSGRILDLCCGIGGDLMAFAHRGPVVGVDIDPESVFCATHNCESIEATSTQVLVKLAESISLDTEDIIHIDPDRRTSQRRTTDLRYFQPPFEAINRWIQQTQSVSLKVAPATSLPDQWYRDFEVEWIGHNGECKQQIVWTGKSAQFVGRRATILSRDGNTQDQIEQDRHASDIPLIKSLSRFIYEPHAAILAATLVSELAHRLDAHQISSNVAYLSGDRPIVSLLASCFEALEILPLRRKAVEDYLMTNRGEIIETKTRGLAKVDLSDFKRLTSHGTNAFSLFLTQVSSRPQAIIARRVVENHSV